MSTTQNIRIIIIIVVAIFIVPYLSDKDEQAMVYKINKYIDIKTLKIITAQS